MRIDNKGYTHKEGLVYKNQFHIIFCPKYRRPVLTNGIDARLKEILTEEAERMNVTIKAMEVMPDHVHLFLEFDPRLMLHKVIKQLKGTSSRILRQEYPELVRKLPSMWTRSYFSCSVGHVSEDTIAQYIEYQKGR
jgi:putative transposase